MSHPAHAQAFSAWIHICAVRLFCESVLRYGVPPKFLATLVQPRAKQEQKLRKLLANMFASGGACTLPAACGRGISLGRALAQSCALL